MAPRLEKSPYETYGAWEKRVFCDNASRRGSGCFNPQCCDGKREYRCTVIYNQGMYDSDTLVLCAECTENLKREARKHGYKFKSKRL